MSVDATMIVQTNATFSAMEAGWLAVIQDKNAPTDLLQVAMVELRLYGPALLGVGFTR
jgi:hypothetical protein